MLDPFERFLGVENSRYRSLDRSTPTPSMSETDIHELCEAFGCKYVDNRCVRCGSED